MAAISKFYSYDGTTGNHFHMSDWVIEGNNNHNMYRTSKKQTIFKESAPKKNIFKESAQKKNPEPNTNVVASPVASVAQDEVRAMATASASERKLSPEQVDYVVEKISEDELDKASKMFVTELKRRFIGSGKVVTIADAMKIAAMAFKTGYKYSTIRDIKKILK